VKKRRAVSVLLAVAVAVGVVASGTTATATQQQKKLDTQHPFRIASPQDETGSNAAVGANFKAGLDIAVKQINKAGGILNRKVVVDYQDTQSSPVKAAQVMSDMLSTGNYQAVIPSSLGATTPAIVEAINRAKILSITPNVGTKVGDPKAFPTMFGPQFDIKRTGQATACLVASYKPKRVAILGIEGPFPDSQIKEVKKKVKADGGKIVGEERYAFDATNITAQVQRIVNAKPDVIYLTAYYGAVTTALQALSDLGANNIQIVGDEQTVIAPPSTYMPKTLTPPKGMVGMGWAVNVHFGNKLTPAQKTLTDQIQAGLGSTIPVALNTFLFPIDALHLMKWAAEDAKSDSTPKMVAALETLSKRPSVRPGTTIVPNPLYSPKTHLYSGGKFYKVDFNGKVLGGTFPASSEVTPPC
jgi:branched-chain amino acid transport system substrate-binding protein